MGKKGQPFPQGGDQLYPPPTPITHTKINSSHKLPNEIINKQKYKIIDKQTKLKTNKQSKYLNKKTTL